MMRRAVLTAGSVARGWAWLIAGGAALSLAAGGVLAARAVSPAAAATASFS